ncbi:hypothetical protein GGR51DRAFT_561715 [Nemania sp. FL0031]|nr:hypothetical protein GGR51DRAFT_561715 [Nemania sp. FL0031]
MSTIIPRVFKRVVAFITPNSLLQRLARYIYEPHTPVENCEPSNHDGTKYEYEGEAYGNESQTPVESCEQYVVPSGCNYKCEDKRCGEPVEGWKFCKDHWHLQRETHSFYKVADAKYQALPQAKDETEDGPLFEKRHHFLLQAISARIVHTELLFYDHQCDGHKLYLGGLKHSLLGQEQLLWMRKGGFVVEGASYDEMLSVAIASFRQACIDWSKSDKQQRIEHFIHGFPRAVASGTTVPDAVLKSMEPPDPDDIEW